MVPVLRFAVFVSLLACLACRQDGAPRAPLTDDFGVPVTIGPPPRRIVSLNPTTTEILFAIGAGGRLVGRSEYDIWPEAARAVPSLGAALRPNAEAILGVHPDLVILYAGNDDQPVDARLRELRIPVAGFKIDRVADFERDTRLLGRLLGDSARADSVVAGVDSALARVRRATNALPRLSVFIPVWDRPLMTVGGGSFLTELLSAAGGQNIYAADSGASLTVTLEDVAKRDPDVVLATPEEVETIHRSAAWRAVRAVRNGRVYAYDTSLVARPSVQLGPAARSLANVLHPGAVR